MGNITRIDNALEGMEPALRRCRNQLEQLNQDFKTTRQNIRQN